MEAALEYLDLMWDRIKFARKEFSHLIDEEQTYKYTFAENIFNTVRSQIKNNNLTLPEAQSIFSSAFQWLKSLQYQLEAHYKHGLSDCEAFLLKKKNLRQRLIPDIEFEQIVDNFNFDAYNYSVRDLCIIAGHILSTLKFSEDNGLDKESLTRFVIEISNQYNVVPFHNFTHAFSVFLMFYQCHHKSALSRYVDHFELFFALIGCLGHDVRSQGVNNAYEAKIKTPRGVDYCLSAVNQRIQLNRFLLFLESSDQNPLLKVTGKDLERAKRIIVKSILATDLARHSHYKDEMKQRVSATTLEIQGKSTLLSKHCCLDANKPDHHEFMIEVMVHACDIGFPCLDNPSYVYWANLICQEHDDQATREAKNGLEVTTHFQYTNLIHFYRNQLSFANLTVLPLWAQIVTLFPALLSLRESLLKNTRKIEQLTRRKSAQMPELKPPVQQKSTAKIPKVKT